MKQPVHFSIVTLVVVVALWSRASQASPLDGRNSHRFRFPGRPFVADDNDDLKNRNEKESSWTGTGREFDLFDTRKSEPSRPESILPDSNNNDPAADEDTSVPFWKTVRAASDVGGSSPYRQTPPPYSSNTGRTGGRVGGSFSPSSGPYYSSSSSTYSRRHKPKPSLFQPVTDWWTTHITPNIKSWPKIQCRVEPTTTLKIRKTFRPLKTIVVLGADFNTQLGVWQFRSSWEDAIIGGKITLVGRELQLTKSWQLSVGAVEDLVTRLRFRAAVDLSTWKAYARVGFRTERLSPINVMEGITLQKQVPLDGPDGHIKLEVKANFALPEPEIEYSTETQRSLIGMGDIEVNIEELNLLLDY